VQVVPLPVWKPVQSRRKRKTALVLLSVLVPGFLLAGLLVIVARHAPQTPLITLSSNHPPKAGSEPIAFQPGSAERSEASVRPSPSRTDRPEQNGVRSGGPPPGPIVPGPVIIVPRESGSRTAVAPPVGPPLEPTGGAGSPPPLVIEDQAKNAKWQQAALERVNAYRKQAGLERVRLSEDLSVGCKAHANYLLQNAQIMSAKNMNPHEEVPSLNGFTEAGRKTAPMALLARLGGKPEEGPVPAVDLWMSTFYHRIAILCPGLRAIGFGYTIKGYYCDVVMDVRSRVYRDNQARWPIVIYPVNGQQDVPRVFSQGKGERPNPIPEGSREQLAGFPITIQFPRGPRVTEVVAVLTVQTADAPSERGATAVAAWVFTPASPALVKVSQENTVCLIPKEPLAPRSVYSVSVTANLNGNPWKRSWTFTTAED
jgi:uncharacterized protein YkwD